MRIHTLEADVKLAKSYERADGELIVTPYPMVSQFTSHSHEVESIEDLFNLVDQCTQRPYECLLKGQLEQPLRSESRSGSTSPSMHTQWVCLDFDYLDLQNADQLDNILVQMGLNNVSYVLQYGSSHMITKDFSAHVYFLLDEPVSPRQLKNWLMKKNLEVPFLCESVTLQRTDVALHWPVDITLAQNDKLIYTASPQCKGFKAPASQRVQLFTKKDGIAFLADEIQSTAPAPVKALEQERINQLRQEKGLPKKTLRTKRVGSIEVATNPDCVSVTEAKNERGFTYLNLNNGDSWGYYFPQDNPEIVYNFKGEPNYYLKDLDPEFYNQYRKILKTAHASDAKAQPFAFLDRKTDKYHRGFYYPDTQQIEIYPTNSLKKLKDFASQTGCFLGDYVEEWDYEFQFDSNVVFSKEDRFVNRYRQTHYLRKPIEDEAIPHDLPPTIAKVLYSVVGDDVDVLLHFLNWLAYILQKRKMAQTAWVFNGREGTGKGVLFNYIISPLVGTDYCKTIRLASLEEDFANGYLEDCIFLMIDESKTSQIKNYEKVMAMLKNLIVEPRLAIRRMQTDTYMVTNNVNVIVTSNYPDAMYISPTDRRFNVGVYQDHKLHLNAEDIAQIGEELWDFAKVLRTIPVDEEKAKTVLQNASRERMMYLTETSVSVAARAVLQGNLEFFIDCLPSDDEGISGTDVAGRMLLDRYIDVLREAERSVGDGKMRLTREQVQVLMEFAIGSVPKSANKFSSFMKHYGIFFKRMRKGDKIPSCIEVEWQESAYTVDDCLGTPAVNNLRAIR